MQRSAVARLRFNGVDLTPLVAYRVHRPVLPPVSVSTETVSGRHGETFRRARLEGYDLAVDMWIRTRDRHRVAEIRHRLAAALWTDEPAPLCLPDDPTRYLLAVVTGDTDLGAIWAMPGATVRFHVCDPVSYGRRRSAALEAGSSSLDTGGTWETLPVITATPAEGVHSWRVTRVSTGEYVEVVRDFDGERLVLDVETERATVGGQTVGVTTGSDFFALYGRETLQVSSGTAAVTWRERWL